MVMSDSEPDLTPLASVKAKLIFAERLIQTASQKLRDPSLSDSRRAELQKIVEDTREDMLRFRRQKDDLEKQ